MLLLTTLVKGFKRLITVPAMDPGRRRILDLAGLAVVASPAAVLGYGALVSRTDFRVREIDVPVPGLAPELAGLRLLLLSDIHLGAFLSEKEFARVIDASNELKPHMATITGDLISTAGDPLDACLRQLARLRSDAGTFGCLGNHEHYARAEQYTTVAGARLGITFLRSQRRALRFGNAAVNLVGVDYQPLHETPYLPGAERSILPGAVNILLSHNPDVLPRAAEVGFDLMLSGHTHGGQVTIEILDQNISPARFLTPYVAGLYREGATSGYVTRGVGTIGIPARVGAPPEITLLRLRKA
jgi:predicted MPP superfamily phosphohydrolase